MTSKINGLIIVLVGAFLMIQIVAATVSPFFASDDLKYLENCPCRKLPLTKCIKQYYISINLKLNWFQAYQYCRSYGMELVTLSTKEENDGLIAHLKNSGVTSGRFWTSGTDLGEQGKFYWMSIGTEFTYTNWDPQQPDNADGIEHCVEICTVQTPEFGWNDYQCNRQLNFVCEV